MRTLGLRLSQEQASEVVTYYTKRPTLVQYDNDCSNSKNTCNDAYTNTFDYNEMVSDIIQGERSILAHPTNAEVDAVRSEGLHIESDDRGALTDIVFTARPARKPRNKDVEAFKLRLRDRYV